MPSIDVHGEPIFYQSPHPLTEPARGARILFVHGPGVDHRVFDEQLQFFAPVHTPIAIDLPGHGHSPGEATEDAVEAADFVKGFIDALNLAPVILCGHSLGGAIALEYTYAHPESVEGLVLVGMGITFPWAADAAADLALDAAAYRAKNGRRGLRENASDRAVQVLTTARAETRVPSAIRDLVAAAKWDATVRLSAIQTPTLVLFGEDDPLWSQAEDLHQAIPHATVEVIPLSRHFPHLEAPDIFDDALNRFVTLIPELTPRAGGEPS